MVVYCLPGGFASLGFSNPEGQAVMISNIYGQIFAILVNILSIQLEKLQFLATRQCTALSFEAEIREYFGVT